MSRLAQRIKRNPIGLALWNVFDWYPSHYSKEERHLLKKLDSSILIFASLSFLCIFLDQTNITNAYVSGMQEALELDGNALNYLNVAYYTAYVVGQIPMLMIQTRPAMAPYFLPSLEIIWAVLTFSQAKVNAKWQLYLIRELVGFFEAPSFAETHFILGSWYRKEELFKRAGCWFMGNSLGSMFSGYLQAAAYKNLSGVLGLKGYQWLFIMDGIITLPIAFIGFAFFPGIPSSRKPWFMTSTEHNLASTRLGSDHRTSAGKLNLDLVKRTVKLPLFWIAITAYTCLIQTSYWTGYMTLWLKSMPTKYSVERINVLPTFVNLLSAFSSWLGASLAGTIPVWKIWTACEVLTLFGLFILTIWDVPDGLKFAAFYIGGGLAMGAFSPVMYSWLNTVLRGDPELRATVTSAMMTAGYSSYVWIPLFTYPTVEAPRFPHGYPASLGFSIGLWGLLMVAYWYYNSWAPDGEKRLVVSDPEKASADDSQVSSEKDFAEKDLVLATPDDGGLDARIIEKAVKY